MNKNLKNEITLAAQKLFNERGYNAVSMRDIADCLNISVGNLTYYFRKKENLVEAAILEQNKKYKKTEPPESLEELNTFFVKILEHQKQNNYYFRHYTQLAQICPNVYNIQKNVINDLNYTLYKGFENLYNSGILKEDCIKGQKSYLVKAIITICVYGSTIIDDMERLKCIWSLIYPLLTEKGITDIKKFI